MKVSTSSSHPWWTRRSHYISSLSTSFLYTARLFYPVQVFFLCYTFWISLVVHCFHWISSGMLRSLPGWNRAKDCFLCLMEFENYVLMLNNDQLWNITALRICSSTVLKAFSPLLSIGLLRLCVTMMLLWPNMQPIVFRKVFPVEGKQMLAMGIGKCCISEEKLA